MNLDTERRLFRRKGVLDLTRYAPWKVALVGLIAGAALTLLALAALLLAK